MTRAFLFPGQGARNVLEAATWHQGEPLLKHALDAAGISFDELTAQAGRALERTEVLQPVLTALALIVAQRIPAKPEAVLGHSLGEVAAASLAGAFDAPTAISLAAARGRLMAREAARNPGGLVALTTNARPDGLELAAINAPDEFVFGGPLDRLGAHQRIPVSGAWHTSAMRGAVAEFSAALHAVAKPLSIPLLRNSDGAATNDVSSLGEQLATTVQFTRALDTLLHRGITEVICVGPGLVMRGLLRKNLGTKVKVFTTEDADDLTRTIAATQA